MSAEHKEFWYWCDVSECWFKCTEEEYHRKHWGKTFTKITHAL